MKEYIITVTECISHNVYVKATSEKEALKLGQKYIYNNDDAPEKNELFTKLDVSCETDFSNADIQEKQ